MNPVSYSVCICLTFDERIFFLNCQDLYDIFCWFVCLHCPKSFQQCSNQRKTNYHFAFQLVACCYIFLATYCALNWTKTDVAHIMVRITSHYEACRRPQQSKPSRATSFPFRPKHDKLGTCTWTKTVKKMTVMMAVRNISLRGKSSFFNRKPREKAMAPRRPP